MRTRAAVATRPHAPLEIQELELDEPRPDEIQVKMHSTGVCHTDAIIRDEWYPVPQPVVLGHEGAGTVEQVGSAVEGFEPGDRVILGPSFCGRCRQCLSGHPMYCVSMYDFNFSVRRADGTTAFTAADGTAVGSHFFGQSSFAEHTNVRAIGAVKVDEDAPLDLLGPLGCGIMTGSGAVLNVLRPSPGSSIAVFGTGAVGMAGMLAARAAGATTIIMVDIVGSRLEFAKELGATHVVNSAETDPVEAIREITGGGVDFALDTTGVPAVFAQMTQSLATRGHGVLVGAAKPNTEAPFDIGSLLMSGVTISMVVEGDAVPREFIPRLISLHHEGLFPFDRLVRTYDFDDINSAFDDSESGKTLKPIIRF